MRRVLALMLPAIAALGLASLGAGVPDADAKIRRVVGSGTQAPDSRGVATAVCQDGSRLVGGGFALDPAYDPVAGTGAQALVQHAFPGDRRGRHATGGGWYVPAPYNPEDGSGARIAVHTSVRITKRSWLIGATRGDGFAGDVVAHVFCDRNWRGTIAERKESVAADDIGRYSATAKCPRWTRVVSGGFKVRPLGTPGRVLTTGLFPAVSVNRPLLSNRGWTATVHNGAGPLPRGKLTVYAYCS
jgi:hypothetical protein